MNKKIEIIQLAEEIMKDISSGMTELHLIILKALRLTLLIDKAENVEIFKSWARYSENNEVDIQSGKIRLQVSYDPHISLSSSNPNEYMGISTMNRNNAQERKDIIKTISELTGYQSGYRIETFNFALGVYNKWKFGDISEKIFERKTSKINLALYKIFPDIHSRLNSIEKNLNSRNDEDWKNAVSSCRSLFMDIAEALNPSKAPNDKDKYINRLKDIISPKIQSKTKTKLIKTYFDELKNRIEYTSDLTQGASHQKRPVKEEAEDIVLYTYLIVGEIAELFYEENIDKFEKNEENKIN